MSSSSDVQIFEHSPDDLDPIKTVYDISPELAKLLQHVVDDVVDHLGCVGAMVATLESDNTMPVRAYSINLAPTLLHQLENRLGATIIGPKSVSYLDDSRFQDNLSVKAVKGVDGQPQIVTSNKLYDLFRPVVNKPLSDIAQKLSGVKQVIAVPFFIDDEVVGNLFAASRKFFTQRDIDFMRAFGRQAAIAIKSQRHLMETQALERVTLALQSYMTDETQVLQTIIDAVVERLGYAGAIVATLETDNTLPIRAYAVDVSPQISQQLQRKIDPSLMSISATVLLDDKSFQENIGVRAIKGRDGQPIKVVISDSLYDLFRPFTDIETALLIQKTVGIKQIIAVPFFIDNDVVGALFVATRKSRFSERERNLLATFGQQAAVGIRNSRVYHRVEQQRKIAQVFAKMAFSAASNVHALRNHIGGFRTYLSMIKLFPMLSEKQQEEVLESGGSIMNSLNEAADILDNLHEPWRQHHDVPTDVNQCLNQAIKKTFIKQSLDFSESSLTTEEGLTISRHYDESLPLMKTSPDMLTEAFRIMIKNAAEAIDEHKQGDTISIETHTVNPRLIQIIIRDNGPGIPPENLLKVFEMGWSSKQGQGMGFGLFWTKDFVDGAGGSIRVESTLNKGTTFYLTLPIKD